MQATFNQPLDTWDVSSALMLTGLFHEAKSFNRPLEGWDVSRQRLASMTTSGVVVAAVLG